MKAKYLCNEPTNGDFFYPYKSTTGQAIEDRCDHLTTVIGTKHPRLRLVTTKSLLNVKGAQA
jgi:hypothetical protein